jgi:hypothetical protein
MAPGAPAFTVTFIVKSSKAPAARSARLQVTVPLACEHAPSETDWKTVCAGTAMLTTGLVSAEVPPLATWKL